ncbi:FAD-binding protein [Rhodopseudomonas palustris]|uniref:FAD linked oxidase-like n=1 Tax=Rhodopseudomonas palustris (strain BisB18) TaxID=316056 RepID=Q20YP9_RHOPB
MTAATTQLSLTGWGNTNPVDCRVTRPERFAEAVAAPAAFGEAGLIARGAGLAYGDAAVTRDGVVVNMTRLDRMLSFDVESGRLRAEAGVSLRDVLEVALPKGFFLPVTPGTCRATIGGAIACDVHGKNHHSAGSFGAHVEDILLLLANGEAVRCSRSQHGELFAATLGGMGLTGIILEATIELMRVGSNLIVARNQVTRDLDETLSVLATTDHAAYSVAWIDGSATGAKLGRGVVMIGDHASRERAEAAVPNGKLEFVRPPGWRLPTGLPSGLISPMVVRLANTALYHRYRSAGTGESLVPAHSYFYPLDSVANWNKLYGRRGFMEYQMVAPEDGAELTVRALLDRLHRSGLSSFFTSMKRMGPQGEGLLSFPMKGIAFSCDLPSGPAALRLFDDFDEITAAAGGRIYFAKDARASARHIKTFYPRLAEFQAVIGRVDPDGAFSSALSRRVGLANFRGASAGHG